MVVSFVFGYSRRFEMIILLLSGVAVNYCLRVSMSVAAPVMADEYGWSVNDEGKRLCKLNFYLSIYLNLR